MMGVIILRPGVDGLVRHADRLCDLRIVDLLRADHVDDLYLQAEVSGTRAAVQSVGISGDSGRIFVCCRAGFW